MAKAVTDPGVFPFPGPPRTAVPANQFDDDIHKTDRALATDEVEFAGKDHPDYNKIDREVAQYASDTRIEISPEKNAELRRMIDRRVLVVMVGTYFLQAIDKGTLSFASIM